MVIINITYIIPFSSATTVKKVKPRHIKNFKNLFEQKLI